MPTKRTKRVPTRIGISEAAIQAWRIGDFHALNYELGVHPFQVSPFDATGPEPPSWCTDRKTTCWCMSWPRGWELRQALLKAAGPPGRFDRHGCPRGAGR
jgi:hypothetical protein